MIKEPSEAGSDMRTEPKKVRGIDVRSGNVVVKFVLSKPIPLAKV
jgi:hypothetical protein